MNDLLVRLWLNTNSLINSLRSGRQPPREIPAELADEFTLRGSIPKLRWYLNDIKTGGLRWTTRSIWWNEKKVRERAERYYKETDTFFYRALDDFGIRNQQVVIVGSEMPWYECVCSYYGAQVTTIEYRPVDCQIPGLRVLTPDQYQKDPQIFDAVVSISSIEHDGLGRYGDPINPHGDLRAMTEFRRMLKPGGRLYLSVPVGSDALVWNAHRIYGRQRLPMLLAGWKTLASYGFSEGLFDAPPGDYSCQPVFVLQADE